MRIFLLVLSSVAILVFLFLGVLQIGSRAPSSVSAQQRILEGATASEGGEGSESDEKSDNDTSVIGASTVAGDARLTADSASAAVGGKISNSSSPAVPEQLSQEDTVTVVLTGAVTLPQVYQVPKGVLWLDVLRDAGGVTPEADQQFVTQELPYLEVVEEGKHMYVPFEGEGITAGRVSISQLTSANASDAEKNTSSQASSSQNKSTSAAQKILINSATQKELEDIPGIGERRATTILVHRPYSNGDDFAIKTKFPASLVQDILPYISFDQ